MIVKINRIELMEQIEKVVRRAGELGLHADGIIHLYAQYHHETGYIERFFKTESVGDHVSGVNGENILALYSEKWFNPLARANIREYFEQELENNPTLFKRFQEKYAEHYPEKIEDVRLIDIDDFQVWFPEKWEELLREWSTFEINYLIAHLNYDDILRQIEDNGHIKISDDFPRSANDENIFLKPKLYFDQK